jgi:2-methylcitrate dehydratase PrpD
VLGSRQKLTPAYAAFANSALVHILDYDDIHDGARLHPTAVTLPAALAAAELTGGTESALADAVTLGNELMCRLGVMCSPKGEGPGSEWFLTQLFGYFGACFACASVLDLSEDEIVSALGLAYMQAAGGKEAGFGVGSTARAIYPAFASMGGVQAALLARAGVVGPESALDGAAGLFRIYLGAEPDAAQLQTLLDRQAWFFRDTEIKPWPSCRLSHPYVAAALAVRAQLGQTPMGSVTVAVNASAARLCRPLEERRRPRTLQDAKYSIPFMIAFTLVHGKVDLESLNTGVLGDTAVLALADRIEIVESLPDKPGHPPAEISVHTGAGSIMSPKLGDLALSAADVREKFFACLRYAGAADADRLWDRLRQAEAGKLADVLRAIPVVEH